MICACCGREIDAEESMICWNCQRPEKKVLEIYSNVPSDDICLCTANCKTKCRRNISQYDVRNQNFNCADFSIACPAYESKEEQ